MFDDVGCGVECQWILWSWRSRKDGKWEIEVSQTLERMLGCWEEEKLKIKNKAKKGKIKFSSSHYCIFFLSFQWFFFFFTLRLRCCEQFYIYFILHFSHLIIIGAGVFYVQVHSLTHLLSLLTSSRSTEHCTMLLPCYAVWWCSKRWGLKDNFLPCNFFLHLIPCFII